MYIHWTKELFKSNQIWYEFFPMCVECKTKKISHSLPGKKFVFQSKYPLIRLFKFQKYRNFIGSRSCSQRSKLICQTTSNVLAVVRKIGPPNVPRKKFVFQWKF